MVIGISNCRVSFLLSYKKLRIVWLNLSTKIQHIKKNEMQNCNRRSRSFPVKWSNSCRCASWLYFLVHIDFLCLDFIFDSFFLFHIDFLWKYTGSMGHSTIKAPHAILVLVLKKRELFTCKWWLNIRIMFDECIFYWISEFCFSGPQTVLFPISRIASILQFGDDYIVLLEKKKIKIWLLLVLPHSKNRRADALFNLRRNSDPATEKSAVKWFAMRPPSRLLPLSLCLIFEPRFLSFKTQNLVSCAWITLAQDQRFSAITRTAIKTSFKIRDIKDAPRIVAAT